MKVIAPQDMPPEQWRPGVETRMLVSARNGAAQLCIFEQWVAPGVGAPTHSHPVEEVLTVREGEAEMWIDDAARHRLGRPVADRAGGAPARLPQFGHGTLHLHAVLASPIFEATPEGATEPVRRWADSENVGSDLPIYRPMPCQANESQSGVS